MASELQGVNSREVYGNLGFLIGYIQSRTSADFVNGLIKEKFFTRFSHCPSLVEANELLQNECLDILKSRDVAYLQRVELSVKTYAAKFYEAAKPGVDEAVERWFLKPESKPESKSNKK